MKNLGLILGLLILTITSGCAVKPYDYTAFHAAKPRSILVIPPMSDSTDVNSTYTFLSTISKPLAEKGYYVFPVAVVDTLLKENGLPTPAEMNSVPLDKIHSVTGADAVLYVHINQWGQKFQVISSVAVVDSTVRLVDTRTGTLLWEAKVFAQQSSSDGGGGLVGALVGAIADQIVGALVDKTYGLSSQANLVAVNDKSRGMLPGPYHEAK
ncbi:hypothetical protein CBP51_06815 [Cellvibrio mixtus]|uniref:Lipoprotein n=1 Tax=Cellvibrio mixtus TaxID=39650 RepID=A0A266QBI8_9GAMM|nr:MULTISPECIES: GNA1162 family protein [Cellvibrio]AQT61956.1 hypothetical protein B0D95_18955 [Cellvibrio sp. PSBB023]OZY86719.1 hypothetical protein CBP51_06815 [Cellvibrio mixtus]